MSSGGGGESSNPSVSDEMVSNFLAFTGSSDPSQAISYLEMSGSNLETAVGLYLEHNSATPGAGGGVSSSAAGGSASSSSLHPGSGALDEAMNYSGITNDSDVSASALGSSPRGTASSSTAPPALGPDGVRAPDQTRTMRLMDDGVGYGAGAASIMPGLLGAYGGMAGDDAAAVMMGTFAPSAMAAAAAASASSAPVTRSAARGVNRHSSIDSLEYSLDSMNTSGNSGVDVSSSTAAVAAAAAAAAAGSTTPAGSFDARAAANAAAARSASLEPTTDQMGRRHSSLTTDDDDDVVVVASNTGSRRGSAASTSPALATDGPPVPPTLSDMFAPPLHLMHRAGGFQGARSVARDARRWLLVNLQRDEDFACHALNRDVWRDELVGNLVQEGYIFWQQMDCTPDGMTYAQRYNVVAYPHVAILDPRTGRLMWRKEGWSQVDPMTAEQFAEIAADFCSRHSFDKPPTAPRPMANGAGGGGPSAGASEGAGSKRPIHEMSEEQQLQAAIRASMKEANKSFDDGDDDDDDDVVMEDSEDEDDDDVQVLDDSSNGGEDAKVGSDGATTTTNGEAKPSSSHATPKKATMADEFASVEVGEEPPAGPGVVRVQFRMPDGARVVRRFRRDDLVKVIFAYVVQSVDDAQSGRAFELRAGFPPKDLYPNLEETVDSSGLAGGSIAVRWKAE